MTFYDCLLECARTPDLVSEFNRLTGRHVGEILVRHPLEAMIDQATGYDQVLAAHQDEDLRSFIEFCHDCVWTRLPRQNAQETAMESRLWTVVRFPAGVWSGGGKPSDSDYQECEVYRIPAESLETAKKKAQAIRARLVKKRSELPTQAAPYTAI